MILVFEVDKDKDSKGNKQGKKSSEALQTKHRIISIIKINLQMKGNKISLENT